MTTTAAKYAKNVGKLFWSIQRNSLVFVANLEKQDRRWCYHLLYSGNNTIANPRWRDAKRIQMLINQGRWITTEEYIKIRTEIEKKKIDSSR